MLFPFDEYWAKITKKEIFFCIFKNCLYLCARLTAIKD